MFGVVFPDRSFPMDASSFTQIDALHWVLDVATFFPGDDVHRQIKQLCVFVLNNLTLPPDKALAVYVQSHSSPFIFCGAVHAGRPSAVLTLPWPDPADQPTATGGGPMLPTNTAKATSGAKIGVSLEDLATLPQVVDAGTQGKVEKLAMRVGENLFNFMQSFCGMDGSRLIVPTDILDRWFIKLQERARRDPDYLKGFEL